MKPRIAALILLLLPASCAEPPVQEEAPAAPSEIVTLTDAQRAQAGIETGVTELRDVTEPLRISGTVVSPDTASASVGSFVEGRVSRVHVIPGDRVQAGAPLVEIHSHELTDAFRDVRAAEAQLSFARDAVLRGEALLESGAISRAEAQRREVALESAEAEAERAREWLEHLHPSASGDVTIEAPMSGTVFQVKARPGAAVVPGDELIQMGATDILWVTAYIPSERARQIQPGVSAHVHFGADPEGASATATLVGVGGAVEPDRNAVEVRFQLDTILPGVRPGQFARVDMEVGTARPRAVVPEDAVQRLGSGTVVFVEESANRFRAVPVSATNLRAGSMAVEGLEESLAGRTLVLKGAYALRSALELAQSQAGPDA